MDNKKKKMLDKQDVAKSFQNAQTKNVNKLNLYVIGEVLKYQNILIKKNVNGLHIIQKEEKDFVVRK